MCFHKVSFVPEFGQHISLYSKRFSLLSIAIPRDWECVIEARLSKRRSSGVLASNVSLSHGLFRSSFFYYNRNLLAHVKIQRRCPSLWRVDAMPPALVLIIYLDTGEQVHANCN
jgi:hypothetical protein